MKEIHLFSFSLTLLVMTGYGIAAQESRTVGKTPEFLKASDQITHQENLYEQACAYTRQGELTKAVESMEKTILYGFYDWKKLKTDPQLAKLRETEWYKAIDENFDDKGIEICSRALSGEPENEIYCRSRGIFYTNKGEYENALEDCGRAIAINPAYPNAYNSRGVIWGNKGEYDKALEDYTKAIALDESYKFAYGNRGLAYHNKGEYDKAIEDYTRAIALDEDYAWAYGNRGETYNAMGEYDKAIEDCTRALDLNPEYDYAFYIRGQSYYYKKDYDKSIEDLTLAIFFYVDYAASFYWRALAYAAKEMNDRAIADYTKAIRLFPEHTDAYYRRGIIYSNRGDYDKALADFNQAVFIDPKYYWAYINRGHVYVNQGEYGPAIEDYTQAIVIGPTIAAGYLARIWVYNTQRRFDLALADADKAIEIDPESAEAYRCRGLAYHGLGNYTQSLADLEKAASLAPDNLNIIFSIGYSCLNRKEYDKAIELYTQFLKQAPDNITAYSNRGIAYRDRGDYGQALVDFNRVIRMDPDYAHPYSLRGQTYEKSGEYEKAIADYKQAFEVAEKASGSVDILALSWYLLNPFYIKHPFLDVSGGDDSFFRSYAQVMTSGIAAGIEKVERLYADASGQGASLMEQVLFLYYAGVDFEVTAGTAEKAFEYSEALRGRGFLEEMGTAAALRLPGITEAEKKNVERLTREIASTRNIFESFSSRQTQQTQSATDITRSAQAQSAADITRSAEANRRLNTLEIELAALDASITDRIPQYGILRNPAPVSIDDARAWCGKDTAVLEYVLWDDTVEFNPVTKGLTWEGMAERPDINSYCLVLTKDGVTPVLLDHTFDYTGVIKQFRLFAAESRGQYFVETMRSALYEKLVKPALPYIPGNIKNIIIVPDGQLAYLPFDILRETGDSPDFGETYALSLSPSVSVSVLAQKRDFQTEGAMLAFADAVYNQEGAGTDRGQRAFDGVKWNNLPGTAAEVASLQKIARSQYQDIIVYTKEEVRESAIKELSVRRRLRQYPIIHFACHGFFNEEDPGASGIVLSEVSETHEPDDENDGYLTIPEIAVLEFNSRMVLLSACETGLSEIKRGQGMVGLSRAFLVAGVGNVGVSLWKIDDSGTSLFMEALYTKVLAENKTFRQAYYEVKNEFRHGKFGEQYTQPSYWAAFIVYE